MSRIDLQTLVPSARNAGTYTLPATQLGAQASGLEIAIDRTLLPNTTSNVAELILEGSDDGITFISLGKCTLSGGVFFSPSGNPVTETFFRIEFDTPKSATYWIRGKATLHQRITAGLRMSRV